MNIFRLHRLLFGFYCSPIVDGESGGGEAVVEAPAAPDGDGSSGIPEPQAASTPDKPATMLDAINQALDAPEPGQPRDDKGRFAKTEAEKAAELAAKPAEAKIDPKADPKAVKPEAPEDLLQMPEGLQPKAQQRFQKLVETNKELSGRIEQADQQTSYIRETFQQHGVRREQFESAVAFIGAVNSGNLEQALRVIDQQRAEIALALGKPLPGVNVLEEHPDLRQAVDSMQITEAHAMELARARRQEQVAQQNFQATQQRQQEEQRSQQEVNTGLLQIDKICKQLAQTDVDYPAIEALLLPEIKNLISGLPPAQWPRAIETQYRLLKQAAAARSQSTSMPSQTVLRPTGSASPAARPRSMHEAMWGTPAPSA